MIRLDSFERSYVPEMVYQFADDMMPTKDAGTVHTFVRLDITGADANEFHAIISNSIALYAPVADILKALPSFNSSIKVKKVIFHDPATIVYWEDGTKTVVKCQDEEFDKEKGLLAAIAKKVYGNKGNFNNIIKKYCETVTNG